MFTGLAGRDFSECLLTNDGSVVAALDEQA